LTTLRQKNWKIGGNHKNQAVNLRTNVVNVDQRFYKIIVALVFSFKMLILQAQQNSVPLPSNAVPGHIWPMPSKKWYAPVPRYFNISQQLYNTPQPLPIVAARSETTVYKLTTTSAGLPSDHYTRQYGFFCRQELLFEKASGLPLRFRLGSLKDCNYLEGK